MLPTFKRNVDMTSSPTNLMANLSTMSLEPMSPSDSFSLARSSSTHDRAPLASSSSSSSSHAASDQSQQDTPQPRRTKPRFSLFPNKHNSQPTTSGKDQSVEGREETGEDQSSTPVGPVGPVTISAQSKTARDDKLRESLYELRQMNDVFEGFLTALESAKGHNEVGRATEI